MPVISISVSSELLRKLDRFMRERGYSSRSEAIRDAIRDSMAEYELRKFEMGRVVATITVISRHERHDVDGRLMRLRHEYDEVVSGNMHIHLAGNYCLEIFIAEGNAEKVKNFIARIRSIRGIEQVRFTIVPIT